ncbi:DUF2177 family protein [Pseudomonas protegens]|uniref:DUF2177 family protein n=1 Tax=Pseudomonas protegens TaxID=380021 RepID=A0A7G8YTA2_9PSED|nr:DUF2177 family protein [Pseudomonas protegens]QNH78900.1 DUF2177 family protein [Pseudomonas protegens]QNL08096.1 DUF2177 family protein [Pseudomonas protegens]
MKTTLVAWLATLLAFLLLDALWLGLMMGPTYRAQLGSLLLEQPRLLPAALFYLLYVSGCLLFAVHPALQQGGWRRAARLGALLGLVSYGTYDLSNWATLQAWPASLALLDMAWGMLVSALASGFGVFCACRWAPGAGRGPQV